MRIIRLFFLLAALSGAACAADTAVFDSYGRLTGLLYGGDELTVLSNLVTPLPGWVNANGLEKAERTEVTRDRGATTWSGVIGPVENQHAGFRQTVREAGGKVRIEIEVSADERIEAEGVFFRIDLPREQFAGGKVTFLGSAAPKEHELPARRPGGLDFVKGEAEGLLLAGISGNPRLRVSFDHPCRVLLRDLWESGRRHYSAFVAIREGALLPGSVSKLALTLSLQGDPDHSAAQLSMDASRKRFKFDGFGGNYCFEIESPVTQYTLKNLRVSWARTEMTLNEWEPVNDNESPEEINWAYFEGRDTPDSNLRREFLLAKQIQDRGIPYAISVWRIPEWLFEDPGRGAGTERRRLALGRWPELLESVSAYLLYAKQKYGVEPDLFSFNEPDWGVDLRFTPEEHRDAIKSFGAQFRRLGLKTKWMLADVASPRDTYRFGLPAANDPEALKYVGAVSFHSWSGASADEYKAWGDLAEWLQLPLLIGEFGVDAFAWQGQMYDSFDYGMREVKMLQELLLFARPQSTLLWEFTDDYSIVNTRSTAGGKELVPTHRFWFVKHFSDLTPQKADVLETASDNPKVLFTAFAAGGQGQRMYALHLANLGAEREVTLLGVPADIRELRAVRTSEREDFVEFAPVKPESGRITLHMPARCLVTLTN
jgi:hypothetical protein